MVSSSFGEGEEGLKVVVRPYTSTTKRRPNSLCMKTPGGHSNIVELLILVNQPQKWTLNGIISVGVFATLNGVTPRISNPKCHGDGVSYLTLNGVYIRQNPTQMSY